MLTETALKGVRTHNLKNIDCSFPHGELTVITGVSGSGKSSLAFDTLYAEGQRRFVESMSTYARQFLERMERPDIDSIAGVQPAIAIEQKNGVRSARSTVGTATEVHDFLRLIFAKLGETICPDCKKPVQPETPDSAIRALAQLPEGARLTILGPTEILGSHLDANLRAELIRAGFFRLWDGQSIIDLEAGEDPSDPQAPLAVLIDRIVWRPETNGKSRASTRSRAAVIDVSPPSETHATAADDVVESLSIADDDSEPLPLAAETPAAYGKQSDADRPASTQSRLHDALQQAFKAGRGRAQVLAPEHGGLLSFSAGMTCDGCGRNFPASEPQMFSFYSPLGACPECEGFGRIMELDFDKVIPNPDLSISDGAIAPWNSDGSIEMYDLLHQASTPQQIPRHKPISEFTAAQRKNLIHGVGDYPGVRGFFDFLESKKYKVQARVMLARYRAYRTCPVCAGRRLKPEALNVLFRGRNISELGALSVREALAFLSNADLNAREREIAGKVFEALLTRLTYLDQIGLAYLTLDRATRTLSGGEAQRINLATSLGSGLTQTLYVLDEPTVGLHPRDTDRLISVLHSLRDLDNTVVVVEHDLEVMRAADRILDLGPGAGELGGELLYEGDVRGVESIDSPTGAHIRAYHTPPVPSRERKPAGWLTVKGARGNNLKNLTVKFPLGVLACVVGVSGSGKTTLVRDTLVAAYRRRREIAPIEVEPYKAIDGLEQIRELHWVDQSPLARSKRSNPVTYVKAFDAIRKALAGTREARAAGLQPNAFSFNSDVGRCPECKGTGRQTIDMHFMADVEILCEACDGRRFRPRVLAYRWNGKNIDDILNLTVAEAADFFADVPQVARALRPLRDVGLGYLRLGQATSTLSGGEAQRLKLAGHLARIRDGEGMLFVFDEPTTGLHPADLERLLKIFHQLVEKGCSILVVEHNLDLIASADYVIELGPEGGADGGRLLSSAPFADFIDDPSSPTARYLRERFSAPAAAKK